MKVKVGNKIYDGENEPIMVILTQVDKMNIQNMGSKVEKYCEFPEGMSFDEAMKWRKRYN